MPLLTGFERERRELEAVIASGIFNRAPNLANLLTYVCNKYFDGAARDIKEYNIAVEALGRPPEFDQKRDSIVRVEAHRLRKRLRAYYDSAGAGHEIQIEIPPGQYTPRFIAMSAEPAGEKVIPEAVSPSERVMELEPITVASPRFIPPSRAVIAQVDPGDVETTRSSRRGWLWILAAGAAILMAILAPRLMRQRPPNAAPDLQTSLPSPEDIRILAGASGENYVDSHNRLWQSDRFFENGSATDMPHVPIILGTRDQRLFEHRREGTFSYHIPVRPGVYEMRLYFAETVYGENTVAGGGETSRIFDVYVNGRPLLPGFDIVRDAGPLTADVKVFKDITPDHDGNLNLDFRANTNSAVLNAIEIVPGVKGIMRPIRMVAREHGVSDSAGHHWDPDRYALGGQLAPRTYANVTGGPDAELFRSERYGNLTYTVPVVQPGRYGITLYFSENWFGPGMAGGGGEGSRVFDIVCNGVLLRRNFDIFHEAGGSGKAVSLNFHGIEPNHRGKIVLSLDPVTNYALVNAIEIVDESVAPN